MRYELLEVQPLKISYEGESLDIVTLGVLQLQLQEITDKVAYSLLSREDLFDREPRSYRPRRLYSFEDDRIIKSQVKSIQSGSLEQEISFIVLSALADPDVRSVLLGVASNIVYAIGTSGVKGITKKILGRMDQNRPGRIDPFNVSAFVRAIISVLVRNGNRKKATLKTSHQCGDEKLEIELVVNAD